MRWGHYGSREARATSFISFEFLCHQSFIALNRHSMGIIPSHSDPLPKFKQITQRGFSLTVYAKVPSVKRAAGCSVKLNEKLNFNWVWQFGLWQLLNEHVSANQMMQSAAFLRCCVKRWMKNSFLNQIRWKYVLNLQLFCRRNRECCIYQLRPFNNGCRKLSNRKT